jgi:hypothetical protein
VGNTQENQKTRATWFSSARVSRALGLAVVGPLLAVGVASGAVAATPNAKPLGRSASVVLADRFTSYTPSTSFTDGDSFGPWNVVFAGYGSVSAQSNGSGVMRLSPAAPTSPAETHAALVVSRESYSKKHLNVNMRVRTTEQLRVGSAPNPWESAWVVWDYTDNDHFTYLAVKPNGWELGKRDPAYPGGQRFLATGSSPATSIGDWKVAKIHRKNLKGPRTATTVKLGSAKLTRFVDNERPYEAGKVGMYSEDAVVDVSRVKVRSY